ncbi:hypothetical protein [Methylobacterium variabile]|nr:hypothetical protein [Methylobacterium variabile]
MSVAICASEHPASARRDLFADIDGDDQSTAHPPALGYITPQQAERNAS